MTQPRPSLVKMNRGLYRYNINPTIVTGTFTIGAAATFYETQQGGQGSIIARTGAGAYTLTMDDADIVEVLSATVCIEDRAGAHTDIIARAEDVAVAAGVATIDIEAWAIAVATDVLTANNLYCHYQVIYSQSWGNQPDLHPLGYWHHDSDPTLVCGRIDIGAAGAPTIANGAGFTIAGGGATGVYTLTFTEAFNQFVSGQVNAGNATAAGAELGSTFGPFVAGAAGAATLDIHTQDTAGILDPANGGSINFAVYLRGESTGA